MHLNCSGTADGSTEITVILEAGANIWSDTWAVAQPELGKLTRTCSYDRAGYGWSQPSINPPTPEQGARDLHALLGAAEIAPPYVLVGHSMGGKTIRLFTSLYPDEVAGLVFVDARHESMEPQGRTPEQNLADREAYESSLGLYRTLRQLGVARLFGLQLGRALDPMLENYPDDVAYRMVLFSTYEQTLQTMMAESRYSTDSDVVLSASQLPENLPIIVLTAESSLERDGWEAGQEALAVLTNNSVWEIVSDSGHNIHAEQPAAVVEAIGDMLNAVQYGQPLNLQN
jgi:pimeloyl-ACP methyl ester carboxylesterase